MLRRLAVAFLACAVLLAGLWIAARAVLGSDLVRRSLEQQLAARTGEPVRIASARAELFPRVTLALHDVVIGDPPAVRLGTVRIVTGLRPLFSRTIDEAEVVVSDSRLSLPLPVAIMQAASAPDEQPSDSSFTIASIRRLAFQDVTLIAGDGALTLDMESSVRGDRLDISSLVLRSPGTRIEASGALTSLARMEGELDARADPLDVAGLIGITGSMRSAQAPPGPAATVHAAPLRIVLNLQAPTAAFGTYAITDIATTIHLAPDRVRMDPLSLHTAGGAFHGRLDLLREGSPSALRLTGDMKGLDVVELMKHSGAPGGLTGRLGGSVSLTGQAAAPDALLHSARGTIRASITDGTLPGLNLVRPIVLAFGRPSGAPPEGSGASFSTLGGTFALVDGRLASDDLAMASRDFDVSGHGALNLITGAVAAAVDVVLSKELSDQAGTDLRRHADQEGRVTVPATIGGTLQRATVSLDVAAAARRAIGNQLRRRTKSLLEDLLGPPRQR